MPAPRATHSDGRGGLHDRLTLALPALVPGCGPAMPEVDKAAFYTPESLAAELAFRFRALSPDAKAVEPEQAQTQNRQEGRRAGWKHAEQAKNKARRRRLEEEANGTADDRRSAR